MGLNKEEFRHFMLDSHKSAGKVLLSKKALQKCTVQVQKKTPLHLLQHAAFITWTDLHGEGIGRSHGRQECLYLRRAASAAAARKGEGSKCNSLCRHSLGRRQRFESPGASSGEEMGAEAAKLSNGPTLPPTPQPTRWETDITWAGNGCISRGVGRAFIWCESA